MKVKAPKITNNNKIANLNSMDLTSIWRFISFYNGKETIND